MDKKYVIRKVSDSSFSYLKDDKNNSWIPILIEEAKKFDSREEAEVAADNAIKSNGFCLEVVELLVP